MPSMLLRNGGACFIACLEISANGFRAVFMR